MDQVGAMGPRERRPDAGQDAPADDALTSEAEVCDECGHVPAIPCIFVSHLGSVVWWSWSYERGTYCRDCGQAKGRAAQALTLGYGWLSPFSFWLLPFLLIRNTRALRTIGALPEPRPSSRGGSEERSPWHPGRPIWQRASIIFGVLIAFPLGALWTALAVALVVTFFQDGIGW
jgi:hypothetical protein